jgi:tRNA uridine 5-carboxymethylaminomethyl modification enzyme
MFTSRAEFRLQLRIDNADERLTPIGRRIGLVSESRWQQFELKQKQKATIFELLERTRTNAVAEIVGLDPAADNPSLAVWLRRPEARISLLEAWLAKQTQSKLTHGVLTTIETETKYAGYLAQQNRQIEQLRDSENRQIPEAFTYERIPGLSNEVRQKLSRVRPTTLGQAQRIPGITPAAIAVLDIYLRTGIASLT